MILRDISSSSSIKAYSFFQLFNKDGQLSLENIQAT